MDPPVVSQISGLASSSFFTKKKQQQYGRGNTCLPAKMNNLYIYQCFPFTQNKIKTWFKKQINKHKYKHILFLYYIFKLFPFTCGWFTVLLSNKVNLNTTEVMLPHSPFYKTASKNFNIVSMALMMLTPS